MVDVHFTIDSSEEDRGNIEINISIPLMGLFWIYARDLAQEVADVVRGVS